MWRSYAIEALWRAAADLSVPEDGGPSELAPYPISEAARREARTALDDLIVESQQSPSVFALLLGVAHHEAIYASADPASTTNDFSRHLIRVFGESSIDLTSRALDELEDMVGKALREEDYQKFLKQHPVILDPLSAEVVPKHKLGTDLVTDFVIRRHDNRYIVVEIEKPQDSMMTQSGDFSAPFTHAVGQVLDFQGWVSENVAYAQKHLPLIENPHGLLVMGRRTGLTKQQEKKLRLWCANSRTIEVVTFDDLVTKGRQLLKSLRPAAG